MNVLKLKIKKYFIDYYNRKTNKIISSKVLFRNQQMFDELFNVIKTFNIKPIILERGEYKEQIISYCYANEIKCFHNFNNQPNINNINNDVKIDLNFLKKTIKEFKECKKNKEKSLKYFNKNKIEYLHLKYNEIITNDGKIKFLNFIGLDFLEEYATIETEKK